MYEYIKGTLLEALPPTAIVETGGIGFCIYVPLSHFSQLPQTGSQVTLFISFVVREDAHKFFGFLTRHERNLFEELTNISGIGPKTALCLIGHMPLIELQTAIKTGNTTHLCKIPGIGKKTAERLVVEMRDKMPAVEEAALPSSFPALSGIIADALSALLRLGYNEPQAKKALKAALSQQEAPKGLSELITLSLRYF